MVAIVNARVRTGDPRRPWADGFLLDPITEVSEGLEGVLAFVGSSADIHKRMAPSARLINALGQEIPFPGGTVLGSRLRVTERENKLDLTSADAEKK
jgi:hypothetical protein